MLCDNCNKLAIVYTTKKCMKCQGAIFINISIICESCSAQNKSCSACFKKIQPLSNNRAKPCGSCGK